MFEGTEFLENGRYKAAELMEREEAAGRREVIYVQ